MNSQPCLLQKVLSLLPGGHLAAEESEQSGAKSLDQSCRRIPVGLLVELHQAVRIHERLARRHILLKTMPHLQIIRGRNTRSYARGHFF
jgi:hypothetical protein